MKLAKLALEDGTVFTGRSFGGNRRIYNPPGMRRGKA